MTVQTDYLSNALDRIVEMQKRAVPETKAAAPYPLFTYENFPYWTNAPGELTPDDLQGADLYSETYLIRMRLVIGHATEGYDGSLSRQLWAWIPQVTTYFKAKPFLQYEAGQTKLLLLDPKGCRIRVARGFAIYLDTPKQQVGTEFNLIVPFTQLVNRT